MRKFTVYFIGCLILSLVSIGNIYASETLSINAEAAFDAYLNQKDPQTKTPAKVAIVDVRTKAEYYWVGTCAKVDKIKFEGLEVIPTQGKVKLLGGSDLLRFKVEKIINNGEEITPPQEGEWLDPFLIPLNLVKGIETTPIAKNIPYKTWDNSNCQEIINDNFVEEMKDFVSSEEIEVVILMCRSGKRSSDCAALLNDTSSLPDLKVYEIDQPDGKNGRGGFQGTSYDSSYNGYRGSPARKTFFKEHQSASWSDAGLPIYIGCNPDELN